MLCGGCYYNLEAVCREYWTCANGNWPFCGVFFKYLNRLLNLTLPLPTLEGSVHSNDSLSDSSPPAPGVPTQVVQPVQATQQVRCTQTPQICFFGHVGASHTTHSLSPKVISVTVALLASSGQCCKQWRRQPRGSRVATSTTYSLCTLIRR